METYVRARIDEELKNEATAVLRDCGLTISAAFRLFLGQVVEQQGLPVEIKRPGARLKRAMEEADMIAAGHSNHFNDAESTLESLNNGEGKRKTKTAKAEKTST